MASLNFLGLRAAAQPENLIVRSEGVYFHGDLRDLDCSVHLRFTGPLASNAFLMWPPRNFFAIDDTGRKMVVTDSFGIGLMPYKGNQNGITRMIFLKGPSATATKIQRLEGEADFFKPSEQNGGRFVLEQFMSQPGKPLRHATLDHCKVKLTYHTMESFEFWRREHPSKYVNMEVEAVRDHFAGILGDPAALPRKYIAIQIDDPGKKLLQLNCEGSNGSLIRLVAHNGVATFSFFYFNEVPTTDMRLVVYLAVPEAGKTARFKVENIALPERPKLSAPVKGAKK